ncbi:hypothetical protein LAC81_17020 [Ensifer adhaerens]|uniref:hypothetical protein n=1 Tax=Ensifer adhaerens TaxID=106592 RepID=UPI001CBB0277|nr:hypothetical protein [Ensifer adhaerens]MBZ7923491.1 hypothetical protein [Ensifer adhaerens]UAX92053.1 hypothetical protein LAC78_17015 [Ensifer adhaerens]UAX99685.1 hypothetical protein LAC80_17020 [Ensifer adhaerens]UAY07069.1 hypothetical protein LAC81_17020 [Ensifer adhaerens]
MISWRLIFCYLPGLLLMLAVVLCPAIVNASSASFPGQWQQVASGTDGCATCWVEISRNGPVLKVTGKDGWFAVMHLGRAGGGFSAEGIGRWSDGGDSHYRGQPFDIRIALVDRHLYMDMTVKMEDGSTRAVRAIFDKRRTAKTSRLPVIHS